MRSLKKKGAGNTDETEQMTKSAQRLAHAFDKPSFPSQWRHYRRFAISVFQNSMAHIDHWQAWSVASKRFYNAGRTCNNEALLYVMKRGMVHRPSTAALESDFSLAQVALGEQHHFEPDKEGRIVLLICTKMSRGVLALLAKKSREIWRTAFPEVLVRQRTGVRADKGVRQGP